MTHVDWLLLAVHSCHCLSYHTYLSFCRYYDLPLPLSLVDGYFFEATRVQGQEHKAVSRVMPHLLGLHLPMDKPGADVCLAVCINWARHQLLLAGERQGASYVGSAEQQTALRASARQLADSLLQLGHLVGPECLPLISIKVHSLLEHAAADIMWHGAQKHYSAQHFEMMHRLLKQDYRATNRQTATMEDQLVRRREVRTACVQLGCPCLAGCHVLLFCLSQGAHCSNDVHVPCSCICT